MYKARDVIGLPVIAVQTGRRVGTVKDLLFDERHRFRALLLVAGNWFSGAKAVDRELVLAMGEDAVTVPDAEALSKPVTADGWYSLQHEPKPVKGIPVITTKGQQLGTLEDVYVEGKLGMKVIGLELSDGFVSDVKEGRKWLSVPGEWSIGEDAIIVPAGSEINLNESILPSYE